MFLLDSRARSFGGLGARDFHEADWGIQSTSSSLQTSALMQSPARGAQCHWQCSQRARPMVGRADPLGK